jgi:hypothetical protein
MYYAFFWKVGIEIMLCGIIESACSLQEKGVKESRIEIPLLNSKWKLSKNNLAATQNTLSLSLHSFFACVL